MAAQQYGTNAVWPSPVYFWPGIFVTCCPLFLSLPVLAVNLNCKLSRWGKIIFKKGLFFSSRRLLEAEVSIPRLELCFKMMQIRTDGAMK